MTEYICNKAGAIEGCKACRCGKPHTNTLVSRFDHCTRWWPCLNAVDEGIALRCRCVKVKEKWGIKWRGKIMTFYILDGIQFRAEFESKAGADACKKFLRIKAKTVRLK